MFDQKHGNVSPWDFQIGENYYLPMTTYLESKSALPPMTMAAMEKEMALAEHEKNKMLTRAEPPGALGFRFVRKKYGV